MAHVLSLVTARQQRQPAPDCVATDDDGRQQYLYVAVYQHGDQDYELELWAYDLVDAERQVLSMIRTLVLVGQMTRRPA